MDVNDAANERTAPPCMVVAPLGEATGSRAVAAALACAGIGESGAPIFLDVGGREARPTLLASAGAKELEELLAAHLPQGAAAARGGFCQVTLPADSRGLRAAATAVAVAGSVPTVVHVRREGLRAFLDAPLGSCASAAVLCSGGETGRAVAVPTALEVLGRGLAVALMERRLDWVTERRALFGGIRKDHLGGLPKAPVRWLVDYAAAAGQTGESSGPATDSTTSDGEEGCR